MKKIIILAIAIMATSFSYQSTAQEKNNETKSFASFNMLIKEGDYTENRFFLGAKFGIPVTENGWFGLNFSFERIKTQTDYDYFTKTPDVSFLGLGGFYRIKHSITEKFSLTNDVFANVLINTNDSDVPKPFQGGISFEAEYNPNPNLGLRVGLGQLSFTKIEEVTLIDLNYLFSTPSISLLFYFQR